MMVVVLIVPQICIYGYFYQFGPILEPLEPILGQLITLGGWKCLNRVQQVWNWWYRTNNYGSSADSTTDMHIWLFLLIWTNFGPLEQILGQLITLGVWKCLNRAQLGWKWWYRTKNYGNSADSTTDMHICLFLLIWTNFDQFWSP